MTRRKEVKDTHVRALKPATTGKRYDFADSDVPGLFVRVTDRGTKTFVLYARFPGGSGPTRRALGEYGALTLADAREKARAWKALIKRGVDPRDEEAKARTAELRKRATTFGAVAEDFIAEKLPRERAGREIERAIRNELLPILGTRPIAEIPDLEILAIVNRKKRTAPVQARNLLALCKRFFAWALAQRIYGLSDSPCRDLKPTALFGERVPRSRVLTDTEIFALWRAVGRLPYPFKHGYRLLMLTALRLNEVADTTWPEIVGDEWIIPGSRMKAKNSRARDHLVPITREIAEVFADVPRFAGGRFVFSTDGGRSPTWLETRKTEIDRRMLRTLRALARKAGEPPEAVTLPGWRNHDIRRTVRSHLSRLRIPAVAAEALLAHVQPGIVGVYDRHNYAAEKREALTAWAARLREIVEPRPSNVVAIRAA